MAQRRTPDPTDAVATIPTDFGTTIATTGGGLTVNYINTRKFGGTRRGVYEDLSDTFAGSTVTKTYPTLTMPTTVSLTVPSLEGFVNSFFLGAGVSSAEAFTSVDMTVGVTITPNEVFTTYPYTMVSGTGGGSVNTGGPGGFAGPGGLDTKWGITGVMAGTGDTWLGTVGSQDVVFEAYFKGQLTKSYKVYSATFSAYAKGGRITGASATVGLE